VKLTKRNHYNPCFWTAFWNRDYYDVSLQNASSDLDPRAQFVHALNVKSDKIHVTKVDNVHFDKNLGRAEITFEAAKSFCKRHHPDKYDDFCRQNSTDYPVYIDFEQILTKLEQLPPYQVLLDVIKHRDLASTQEKAWLANFVFIQLLRSHAIMNSAIELNSQLGSERFEYFIMFKWLLSDPDFLYPAVNYLASSLWVLYRTDKNTFPLTDSPVLVHRQSIIIALSPRLLLEIFPQIRYGVKAWITKDHIESEKLAEFRQRTIGNTFREIIFSDKGMLEHWQATREFRQRVDAIKKK
jgi:hypothetical protein